MIASLPSPGLLTLAGMTPDHHEVSYIEVDELAEFDHQAAGFDLVAISSLTARIDDAYALTAKFREWQIPVVMGGLHVSVLPEEAMAHCDAVVVGSAEGVWPELVADAERGELEPIYRPVEAEVFSDGLYQMPAYHLMAGRKYNRVAVQTSRGCPRACEFCGASRLLSPKFQQKPVRRVIGEIREARRWIDRPFFAFASESGLAAGQRIGREIRAPGRPAAALRRDACGGGAILR